MEYIEGKEIFELISEKDHGKYTEEITKELFKQIMEGIEYIHK